MLEECEMNRTSLQEQLEKVQAQKEQILSLRGYLIVQGM